MPLDMAQWTFLTKIVGITLDPSQAPAAVVTAKAATEAAKTFDPSTADAASIKAVAEQVGDWTKTIKDTGRDQAASGMSDANWNAHVKTVRDSIAQTRELRSTIKAQLTDTTLDPKLRSELEALQAEVNAALIEAMDLEPAHGPTNHLKISPEGMCNRALFKINPRTGAATDSTTRATRFASPEAFLTALDSAMESQTFKDEVASRTTTDDTGVATVAPADTYFKVKLDLEAVYGPDYKDMVEGQTVIGSGGQRSSLQTAMDTGNTTDAAALVGPGGPVGLAATDFTDGSVSVGFTFIDGQWELSTIFPVVAAGTTRNRPPEVCYDPAAGTWMKQDPARSGDWHPFNPEDDTWINP